MLQNLAIRGIVTGLTPAEKAYLILHPTHISKILDAKDKAEAETKRRFGDEGIHNGTGDAFRHCYASALLTKELGAQGARQFTSAHEAYGSNPAGERQMDLNNNSLGITMSQIAGVSATDNSLSSLCKMAIDKAFLTTEPVSGAKGYGED